jgi:hypothetical protein
VRYVAPFWSKPKVPFSAPGNTCLTRDASFTVMSGKRSAISGPMRIGPGRRNTSRCLRVVFKPKGQPTTLYTYPSRDCSASK